MSKKKGVTWDDLVKLKQRREYARAVAESLAKQRPRNKKKTMVRRNEH